MQRKLLGDKIERALTAVGITPQSVANFLRLDEPCDGCEIRKQRLNALDQWATRVIEGKLKGAREYLRRILSPDS